MVVKEDEGEEENRRVGRSLSDRSPPPLHAHLPKADNNNFFVTPDLSHFCIVVLFIWPPLPFMQFAVSCSLDVSLAHSFYGEPLVLFATPIGCSITGSSRSRRAVAAVVFGDKKGMLFVIWRAFFLYVPSERVRVRVVSYGCVFP